MSSTSASPLAPICSAAPLPTAMTFTPTQLILVNSGTRLVEEAAVLGAGRASPGCLPGQLEKKAAGFLSHEIANTDPTMRRRRGSICHMRRSAARRDRAFVKRGLRLAHDAVDVLARFTISPSRAWATCTACATPSARSKARAIQVADPNRSARRSIGSRAASSPAAFAPAQAQLLVGMTRGSQTMTVQRAHRHAGLGSETWPHRAKLAGSRATTQTGPDESDPTSARHKRLAELRLESGTASMKHEMGGDVVADE